MLKLLYSDVMRLAAQKNEYHKLLLSTCDATVWYSFGAAFISAMVVSATVSIEMLTSKCAKLDVDSQL